MASSYKELIVWQKSMELVTLCYALTKLLPAKETYSLANQLTRAAVSVPSNLAEGYRRNGKQEYLHFCGIAAGSAAELETQLIILHNVYQIDISNELNLVTEVQKMLYALIKRLKTKP